MPVRNNGYFNNPAFAQAASNLTSLFEPPSGADAAGWATATAKRQEAQRLQDLFDYSTNPEFNQQTFDRMGVGAGAYAPSQSYYSVDLGDATTRRGQDVAASTSRSNNAADNARALDQTRLTTLGDFYDPLNEGQVRPEIPADIASMYGVDHTLRSEHGLPKPRTETEVKGGILQSLPPELQNAIVGSGINVESIQTPEGPKIVSRNDAIGQPPLVKDGNGLSVTLPDGTVVQQGGKGPSEAQGKNIYAGTMATAPTLDLLRAYDTGALPTGTDFQLNNARGALPEALAPVIAPNISEAGQIFYQNLSTALPYQLMSQSGQAVTEQEYQRKLRELVPVPGEAAQVTQAKRRQLETYLEAVSRVAGPGGAHIGQALQEYRSGAGAPAAPAAPAAAPAGGAGRFERGADGKLIRVQ